MVKLWHTKIKLGLATLEDVPERYYEQVKALIEVAE